MSDIPVLFVVNSAGELWQDWPHHPLSASCSCGWVNEAVPV